MKRISLIIVGSVIFAVTLKAQVRIDSMYIYQFFSEKGYTTAGVYSRFRELQENQIKLIKVSVEDQKRIVLVMEKAKSKKHKQTKLGTKVLFARFMIKDQEHPFLIGRNLIFDMNSYHNYWITDKIDQTWLNDFIQRIKEEN